MNPSMHAYEHLTLYHTGIVLGLVLVVIHSLLLFRAEQSKLFLIKFPRNQKIGQVILGLGMLLFFLAIKAPIATALASTSVPIRVVAVVEVSRVEGL